MKVRVGKYFCASLADLGMNSSAEEPERPGPPVRGDHSRRGEVSGRNYNLFFPSRCRVSNNSVSVCERETPWQAGGLSGTEGTGRGESDRRSSRTLHESHIKSL